MSRMKSSQNARFSSTTRSSSRPRENSRIVPGSIGNSIPIFRRRIPYWPNAGGGDPRLGGGDLIGDIGHDLDAHPEPRVARELEAEPAEVEDFLRRAGKEHREERVIEGDLGVRRNRGRLGERVVPAQREHAAVTRDAREVRVLENITGAVDAGPLAVPHAEHAVVLRLREQVRELAAVDRRRPEILVHTREEDDVVLAEQSRVALEREVEAAERGASITADDRGGV